MRPTATESGARERYRVHLLPDAEPTERGIVYRRGEASSLLEWSRIERALAAEVGEPEGVRTVVFDLVVGEDDGSWRAYRLDADPAGSAAEVARAIAVALGPERAGAAIKNLAAEGRPGAWYPDLESFEEAALAALAGT